jgi:hypothetical protein
MFLSADRWILCLVLPLLELLMESWSVRACSRLFALETCPLASDNFQQRPNQSGTACMRATPQSCGKAPRLTSKPEEIATSRGFLGRPGSG